MASRPRLDQFNNAFARYLPQFQPPQRHNPQETVENRPFPDVAVQKPLKPAVALTCGVVAVENPGSGDEMFFLITHYPQPDSGTGVDVPNDCFQRAYGDSRCGPVANSQAVAHPVPSVPGAATPYTGMLCLQYRVITRTQAGQRPTKLAEDSA